MILLGITGPIGHGKTTLAQFITGQESASYQTESSQIISEVADRLNKFFFWEAPDENDLNSVNRWLAHLPAILEAVTHQHVDIARVTLDEMTINSHPADYDKLWEYIYTARHQPSLVTEHINADNKTVFRALLQWLGGYLVKHVDTGIWYNELVRRAAMAEEYGCQLFVIGGLRFPTDANVVRAAGGKIIRITRPDMREIDKSDPTERERAKITADATITNNGSLDDLLHCAMDVYSDLLSDSLKKSYKAAVSVS